MAYHTEWSVAKRIEELPYKIIPGEVGNFRNDVFLERAIVGERLRLAMGLPYRSAAEHAPLSDNIEAADQDETYYTPPLINVIKFACNGCKEKQCAGDRGLPGLPGSPLCGGLPQGCHHSWTAITAGRSYRPGQVHQVRPLRWMCAPITPSSSRSGPAPRPAA